jgi:flagellar protein FlbD
MIKLTRISGEEFVVNAERIQYVEAKPDTIITLVGKERLIVTESVEDVPAGENITEVRIARGLTWILRP